MSGSPRRGAIASGFAALTNWRLAAILIAATLLPALLVASALWPALRDGLGGTLAGDHIVANDPLLAPTDVFDFIHEKRAALAGASHAAWIAALLGVLVQVFFAGGFVRSLGRPGRAGILDFVDGSRRDFWHNAKCFVLFAAGAAITIGGWTAVWRGVAKKAFENAPPASAGAFVVNLVTIVGGLLLYAGLSLWQDFARAARRIAPAIGAWRAYGFARRRLAGRRTRALGLFLFWLLLGGTGLLLLFALSFTWPAETVAATLALFLVQLATLSVRPLVRVAAWGSYIALLDEASAPPEALAASALAPPLRDPEAAPPANLGPRDLL